MNDDTYRTYRTPRDCAIPGSPFKTPAAMAEAMTKLTGWKWRSGNGHVGGRGQSPRIFSGDEIIYIWQGADGGWHPEHKVGSNWLPDLTLLDKLIDASKPQEFDAEPSCGNVREEEDAYYRHPD
jgi:hypothetical protein